MDFHGANVLVTGASRGIGAAIARVLAKEGLKVWINYRTSVEAADRLKKEIEEAGGRAALIPFDVANEAEFVEGIATIVESDGGLAYLVNNAGITKDKLAMRMGVADFEEVLRANLTSAFIGCREALKVMGKRRFGSVVNVASIVGERGNPGQVNYSASKGGMIAMTKSFALEGAPRNVRFNVVTPGFIETDMTQQLKEEIKERYVEQIPLGRFGKPEEVAWAVAFLLSDHASYITGTTLRVNGGLYT
ncbi:MAG: 3-oxoacyl-ACP reductase FabG [Nitratiruptor sp.]|nr:3-oxoacyl-ACP reductase FabG [Nitratiruptor sp.]NPA83076.1 3-oxoacyl-ACP reductase FabG [Campylobacterota bacterium]